jgi:hypothetical protein
MRVKTFNAINPVARCCAKIPYLILLILLMFTIVPAIVIAQNDVDTYHIKIERIAKGEVSTGFKVIYIDAKEIDHSTFSELVTEYKPLLSEEPKREVPDRVDGQCCVSLRSGVCTRSIDIHAPYLIGSIRITDSNGNILAEHLHINSKFFRVDVDKIKANFCTLVITPSRR